MCGCFGVLVYVGLLAERAVVNVIGDVNGVEFGVASIDANITRRQTDTLVSATVHQIPAQLGKRCSFCFFKLGLLPCICLFSLYSYAFRFYCTNVRLSHSLLKARAYLT